MKKNYCVNRKWWRKWMEKIKVETKKLRLNMIQRLRCTHRGIEMSRHFFSTVYSRTAMSCSIFFAAKFCKKKVTIFFMNSKDIIAMKKNFHMWGEMMQEPTSAFAMPRGKPLNTNTSRGQQMQPSRIQSLNSVTPLKTLFIAFWPLNLSQTSGKNARNNDEQGTFLWSIDWLIGWLIERGKSMENQMFFTARDPQFSAGVSRSWKRDCPIGTTKKRNNTEKRYAINAEKGRVKYESTYEDSVWHSEHKHQ